jgi:hypothetical protein
MIDAEGRSGRKRRIQLIAGPAPNKMDSIGCFNRLCKGSFVFTVCRFLRLRKSADIAITLSFAKRTSLFTVNQREGATRLHLASIRLLACFIGRSKTRIAGKSPQSLNIFMSQSSINPLNCTSFSPGCFRFRVQRASPLHCARSSARRSAEDILRLFDYIDPKPFGAQAQAPTFELPKLTYAARSQKPPKDADRPLVLCSSR